MFQVHRLPHLSSLYRRNTLDSHEEGNRSGSFRCLSWKLSFFLSFSEKYPTFLSLHTFYHIFLSFIVRNFEIISSDILGYFPFFRSIIQNYLVYPPPLTHFFLNYSGNLRIYEYLGCGDSGQTGETLSTYQKRRWVQLLYILNLTE